MKKELAICTLACAMASSLTGCGGGSSSPMATGDMVTVTFSGPAPVALADQIGTGPWSAASLQGKQLNLTVPAGTSNYAIAWCAHNGQ
jgi:hypothetical protein